MVPAQHHPPSELPMNSMLAYTSPIVTTALIRVLALSALSLASTIASAASSSSDFDIKGLRLGMPSAEAKALIPSGRCDTLAPGIELCVANDVPFAGATTRLVTKHLDGSLISITATDINRTQAASAGLGLADKFGSPDNDREISRVVRGERTYARTMLWRRGEQLLLVIPFDQPIGSGADYTAAILLVLHSVHETTWIPRSRGEKVKVATDI